MKEGWILGHPDDGIRPVFGARGHGKGSSPALGSDDFPDAADVCCKDRRAMGHGFGQNHWGAIPPRGQKENMRTGVKITKPGAILRAVLVQKPDPFNAVYLIHMGRGLAHDGQRGRNPLRLQVAQCPDRQITAFALPVGADKKHLNRIGPGAGFQMPGKGVEIHAKGQALGVDGGADVAPGPAGHEGR